MNTIKINELPQKEFTSDMIDHCFYVENMNQPEMRLVPLLSIFDRIKKEATKSGLTVKMEGEKIMFISKDNNMKKESLVYSYDCLKDAMEIIDDYLNAGTKEERTKSHKKAKELYKVFHGKDFVNRTDRDVYFVLVIRGTNAFAYELINDVVRVTLNIRDAISFPTWEHAQSAALDFRDWDFVVKKVTHTK